MNMILKAVLIAATAMLTACGLPKEDKARAEAAPQKSADMTAHIAAKEAQWKNESAAPESAFLKKYESREQWLNRFADARTKVAQADELYEKEVKPLLEQDDRSGSEAIRGHLDRFDARLADAKIAAAAVHERVDQLKKFRNSSSDVVALADTQLKEIGVQLEEVRIAVEKAVAHFPESESIVTRHAPFKKMGHDSYIAFQKSNAELSKKLTLRPPDLEGNAILVTDEEIDYAVLGDEAAHVGKIHDDLAKKGPEFLKALESLYFGYSKTLVDMRTDYYVQIGRTSWDESSDFDTDHHYIYDKKKVDESTYTYFETLPDDTLLANIGFGFFGQNKVLIDENQWAQLNIDWKEGWPSTWHGNAEFWVSETPEVHFHKYEVRYGTEATQSDWVEVRPEYFEEHEDDLGMEIVSKPIGTFEDEKLTQAVPPGLAYVGNSEYGAWKQDASGNRFWEFYGQWAFFNALMGNGSNRYGYGEWDTWRSQHKGKNSYYGDEDEGGHTRYGTYSTYVHTHPRYQSSNYAAQGGLKSAKADVDAYKATRSARGSDTSVRGAGPARRGGGPGGGGK